MLVTCSAHTANNGTGSPPHLTPLSLHYLSLFTSLLRFVPTVGVVFVLCMRAVTCKNGRRRAYFGSWLHLDSPFLSPRSFATPYHPHSFVAFLVVAEGERVALRSAHVAYNFIHHTSKKRKKIYRAASNLIGSSRFFLAFF